MNLTTKKIVLISASPKVDQEWAVSDFLARYGEKQLSSEHVETQIIHVRHTIFRHESAAAFEWMQAADALILIFPLYIFCLPAMLTRFLQDFASAHPRAVHGARVYAIVNCGFPEPQINEEAMRVIEQFAKHTGRVYLGGVLIGCGGMILGAQGAPFMRPIFRCLDELFERVKGDDSGAGLQNCEVEAITVNFPRSIYFLAGNAGWHSMSRKNHLKRKDLYRKPYEK